MIRVEFEGSNRACHGEHSADSVMALARVLVAAGFPDQPLECYRGNVLCLKYRSLAWAAAHWIREEPRLSVEKFRPADLKNLKHGTATGTDGQATRTDERPWTLPST